MNCRSRILIGFLVVVALLRSAPAADRWPQFRGPTGDGYADADGLPITWSETENIVWKTPIHGRGWSSPVVWGEQVWMSTATEDGHEMFAVCVALDSGEILHDVKVFANGEIVQKMGPTNSYASPTPVIEEGRVYVHFGVYGTACLDTTSGKVLWQRRDVHCDHFVGPGSSPILWNDLLIFHMDGIDVQYVIALDKQTGRTVWKTARSVDFTGIPGDFRKAYSTPLVIETGGTRQLISTGAQGSYAYDPTTGEELWRVRHKGFSNVSRPLFGHGLVYLNSAYPKASLIAMRPDGRGDVTDSHVAWKFSKGVPVKPSPVLVGDWIFAVNDKGISICLDATTGELIWQQRIGGEYSASPIHADGRIFFFSHDGKATVIEAAGEYKELAVNPLGAGFMASPAMVDKALILRTKTHLYRVEETGSPRSTVGADIAIPARNHAAQSPHVVSVDKGWSDLVVCHGTGGMQQWDFDIETAGEYYLHTLYASAGARPVRLFVNGEEQDGTFMKRVTGDFFADALSWDTCGPFDLVAGKNSIRIQAVGSSPHLAGLVISNNEKEWNKKAFEKLYPDAGVGIEERIAMLQAEMAENRAKLREKLGVDEIVFIKRIPYDSNHYYTEYLNSRWMPGGGIFVLSLEDGSKRQIAKELKGGIFGRFDLSFDAKKIVFDWKRSKDEGYRIYEDGMENVESGEIKHLRVLEQIPRPWSARRHGRGLADSYDQQYAVVSKDGALGLKVQHGVVPVEEDGSAHFLVPANANIFIQALDENYLAVQTERTFVNYMPGETRACIGCHETPDAVPTSWSNAPLALTRNPSLPGPQIGETAGRRSLHYPTDVQPVLDGHCVECHNEERNDGGLDLTDRLTQFFSASYENLLIERRGARKERVNPGLVPTIGENHPKAGNVRYLPARSLGSHNSLLIAMLAPDKVRLTGDEACKQRLTKLTESHKDVKLKPEELLKISNWVDTNAQFYGSYYGRRNLKDKAHPNFRPVPTWKSAIGIPPLPEEER